MREAETKFVSTALNSYDIMAPAATRHNGVVGAGIPPAQAAGGYWSTEVTPTIVQGDDTHQRIGDKVRLMRNIIRLVIKPADVDDPVNAFSDKFFKIYLLRCNRSSAAVLTDEVLNDCLRKHRKLGLPADLRGNDNLENRTAFHIINEVNYKPKYKTISGPYMERDNPAPPGPITWNTHYANRSLGLPSYFMLNTDFKNVQTLFDNVSNMPEKYFLYTFLSVGFIPI